LDNLWEGDGFFDDPELDDGYTSPSRAHDAAAVSAVLTRMQDGPTTSAPGTLRDRISEIRVRETAIPGSGERDMAQDVVRLVEEIRPLLTAAKEAGIAVEGLQRSFSEALRGRQGDLAYRLRLVEQLKATLEAALSEHVSQELHTLLRDLERAKAMTDQAHGAELTAAEAIALLDTGHYAAAFNRARTAREIVEEQLSPTLPPVPLAPTPSTSFTAFVGPALSAAAYVAIAAMLLPGVVGFLETNFTLNTGAILFLSYGWFGLVLYAILSIYAAMNPAPGRARRWESFEDEF
jgi:DNA-binding phage protein